MTKPNSPAPNKLDSLKRLIEQLSAEERCAIIAILSAINDLELMRSNGNSPSIEVTLEKLAATGHLDIALDCYRARQKGNPQLA